jgi:DNA modification methylase
MCEDYEDFLAAKAAVAPRFDGFDVNEADLNPDLKPHTRRMVAWALQGGRRAWFASFGLHKTATQIEAMRIITARTGRPTLIVAPLGVRREFIEEAKRRFRGDFAVDLRFIRSSAEVNGPAIYLTNYESVREGKVSPDAFVGVSLDEAAILRGFGGTKTFREFMAVFAGDDRRDKSQTIRSAGVQYRFVATATPSPNDYIELLAYAAFLDVMDVSAAKTRFFKRDSTKADNLTLMAHKAEEFWMWVASWALFVTRPSDLDPAFSDEGYDLPPLMINWHEIPTDHAAVAGHEKSGQGRMIADATVDLSGVAREKRASLPGRIDRLMTLRAEDPAAHRIIWHDLEDERRAIEKAVPGVASVFGSQPLEEREDLIGAFADGQVQELAAKPVMLGSGTNLQKHCAWAIFLGIGFKFNDFIQAVHRLRRFGQGAESVRLDLIYTEAERGIRRALERKWQQHNEMVAKMVDLIREYGLSEIAMQQALTRAMGVKDRIVSKGDRYRIVHNDCVDETRRMKDGEVQLVVTSIPFSTQYEYSPNYADFGHTDNDAHFWTQMGFLIPELLRVLEPGRICAIHVKDRIIPGGINGFGFQTLSTLHMDCVREFQRHGFAYLGMKTIVTDVVRENNQTYRLGWTEQCKDGTRMGAGVPEYLLIFRRPPSDAANGYADRPVRKAKKEWDPAAKNWRNEGGYSRARWQLDAHGFARSSGNRSLLPGDLDGLDADVVYKTWKAHSLHTVYDFEHHVQVGEHLEAQGRLPPTFMLLPPHTMHPDVWTDVARMMTINAEQERRGNELHLCPLQYDIVDRAVVQYTEPGETVYDPFGGLMTVPFRAIKLGRKGIGCELNPIYYLDGLKYVEAAAREVATPSLFDFLASAEATEGEAA